MAKRARVYRVRAEFRAPVAFVLRWCTDYTSDDPALEGERFRRKILQRNPRRVVYEDLDDSAGGWMWSRWTVTIQPPDRWHGEAVGNYRGWSIDYRLTPLPGGRTRFDMKGLRFPLTLGARNPPKRTLERELAENWRKFGRALERDYRKASSARSA